MKWWLISEESVRKIRAALENAERHERGSECTEPSCPCHARTKLFTDAIHELDSGLHTTEAVPADFKQ